MTAVMKILGWKSEGLRCPDHEVDCCRDDGNTYAVSLIQMPNGTGKTTTLMLLRAALSGELTEEVQSFKKRHSDIDYGRFSVTLLLNQRRVTITMFFDFQQNTVKFATTKDAGQVEGFVPPADFKRFLSPEFIKFFVFDGELAQHLLDKGQVQAENVLEVLFQINSLNTVSQEIRSYWDIRTARKGATEDRGLTRSQNKVMALRTRRDSLIDSRTKEQRLLDDIQVKLEEQRKEYETEIAKESNRTNAIDAARVKFNQAVTDVNNAALDLLDQMRDPHALSVVFARELSEFKAGLDRVKLPEGAAREFFEELAEEKLCVCGRPIDSHISAVIRERAQQYLGTDDVSLLNSLKSSIQESLGDSIDSTAMSVSTNIEELANLVTIRQNAQLELDELLNEAAAADPKVREAAESSKKLESRVSSLKSVLMKYDDLDETKRDEDTYGIPVIRHRLEDAERRASEIAGTLILKDKRDTLTKIVESAYKYARKLITEEIIRETNERIARIMPSNDITIERIDNCLILGGQGGASMGETLSVAYAFLATLFHRAEHQLPFVVDSPAGSIDLEARPRIGELVPGLTGQFIAFTISSERNGFVPRLKSAANHDVLFLTIFRKGGASIRNSPKDGIIYDESDDGVTVKGESFFNEFQVDTED